MIFKYNKTNRNIEKSFGSFLFLVNYYVSKGMFLKLHFLVFQNVNLKFIYLLHII